MITKLWIPGFQTNDFYQLAVEGIDFIFSYTGEIPDELWRNPVLVEFDFLADSVMEEIIRRHLK